MDCVACSRPSIYNWLEFPTAVVHRDIRTEAARGVVAGEDACATLPEGAGGNARASRFHEGSIGKETPVGFVLPAAFLPKSYELRVGARS